TGQQRSLPLRLEMLACEPEKRQCACCQRNSLRYEEKRRARPQPPEWNEQHDDGVDVDAEPAHLVTADLCHLEEMAVRRCPNGLGEVPQVVAPEKKPGLGERGGRRKPGRPERY